MSHTIAHRRRVQIPWTTIAVVLVATLAAAAVLVIVNQPADVTDESPPVSLAAPGAVAVPQVETRAQILALTGRAPGADVRPALSDRRRNIPAGVSLDQTWNDEPTTAVPHTRHAFPAGR
jgi:hypothetical protein